MTESWPSFRISLSQNEVSCQVSSDLYEGSV
jgi:hypothetical protein